MKRMIVLLITAALMFSLCACNGDTSKGIGTNGKSVSDVLEQRVSSEDATESSDSSAVQSATISVSTDVDVDLTVLSSTMVYSQVLDMMASPKKYQGKSVRMSGDFAVSENVNRNYYACIIKDATACCASGIEFLWAGEHSYPEDYPKQGTKITVVGNFDSYYEGEQMYIQLVDAEVSF